nr:MAG TPA: hypothetical protein [Caudoviricetes sp.]
MLSSVTSLCYCHQFLSLSLLSVTVISNRPILLTLWR